ATPGAVITYTSSGNVGFGTAGTGSIASFAAVNNTTGPVTATVTVSALANDCQGAVSTFTVTVIPTSTVNPITAVEVCAGATASPITFTSPVAGTTFSYTSSTNVGFGTTGTGSIGAFTALNPGSTPVTATITVVATIDGCQGPAQTFTLTVNPSPTVSAVNNLTICNDATASGISFSSPTAGATFSYTSSANIGFGTSGTGNIAPFVAVNNGTAPVTTTITVVAIANGCAGTAQTFVITVNPSPAVNPVNSLTLCNGTANPVITFGSLTPGATFAYTSSSDVGFGLSGSTAVPSFTAVNQGTAPVTTTVTVTATANGCTGIAQVFTITVEPSPTVNAVSDVVVCNGAPVSTITFGGPVAGAVFQYTSSVDIGFGTTGAGNIAAFTAANTGATPLVATITVTATAAGCVGAAQSFSITVNPGPAVSQVNNFTNCNGANTLPIVFNSPTPGATFAYTSSSDVGFGLSGTGNLASFVAVNTTTAPITTTVTVTATANGCQGPAQTFTFTVEPSPAVNTVADLVVCNGATVPAISLASPTAGAAIRYTATSDVGFGVTGTGSIASFTAINNSPAPISTTVSAVASTGGCEGPAQTFVVTINPSPVVAPVADLIVCTGQTAPAITFSSATPGATFSYSVSGDVGFGTSGSGNVPAFTTVNNTANPITVTLTVVATANGCAGAAETSTITINPSPTVAAISSMTYCDNAAAV
ncbi:MAG TPA: hypothetical protein VGB67_07635, partial [Fibrella sp.]